MLDDGEPFHIWGAQISDRTCHSVFLWLVAVLMTLVSSNAAQSRELPPAEINPPTPPTPPPIALLTATYLPATADPKRTPTTGALIQPHVYTSMMSPTRPIRLPPPGLELKLYTPSTVPAIQSRQPAETKVALIARSGPALCTESNEFSVSNWGGIAVFTLAPVDRESDPQPSSQPTYPPPPPPNEEKLPGPWNLFGQELGENYLEPSGGIFT